LSLNQSLEKGIKVRTKGAEKGPQHGPDNPLEISEKIQKQLRKNMLRKSDRNAGWQRGNELRFKVGNGARLKNLQNHSKSTGKSQRTIQLV